MAPSGECGCDGAEYDEGCDRGGIGCMACGKTNCRYCGSEGMLPCKFTTGGQKTTTTPHDNTTPTPPPRPTTTTTQPASVVKQRLSYFDLSQPLHTLEGWVVVVVGLGGGVGVVLSWGVVVVFCPPVVNLQGNIPSDPQYLQFVFPQAMHPMPPRSQPSSYSAPSHPHSPEGAMVGMVGSSSLPLTLLNCTEQSPMLPDLSALESM